MRDTAKSRSCWRLKFLRDATVVLALLLPAALAADAIRLNGGQVLDGRIVEESDKTIIFETDLGVLAIPRSDIVEIERQGGARIPRTQSQSASPGEAALYSLIPFYSGFYRTRAQEFGVLPSLLQGYLAIQAILYNPLAWRRAPVTLQDHYLGGPFADPGRNLALPLYYTTALGPIEARGPAPQFFFSESLYQYDDRYIPIRILGGAVVPQKLAAKRWRNAATGYLLVSGLHVGLTYLYALTLGKPVAAASPGRGIDQQSYAYVVPNGDGGVDFGLSFSF